MPLTRARLVQCVVDRLLQTKSAALGSSRAKSGVAQTSTRGISVALEARARTPLQRPADHLEQRLDAAQQARSVGRTIMGQGNAPHPSRQFAMPSLLPVCPSTWPPCPAAHKRAARCTSSPTYTPRGQGWFASVQGHAHTQLSA